MDFREYIEQLGDPPFTLEPWQADFCAAVMRGERMVIRMERRPNRRFEETVAEYRRLLSDRHAS